MIHRLNKETKNVQNPALGAMLIWRFVAGYERGSSTSRLTPIPLLFLVLPMLLHQETAEFVVSTQEATGLRAFASKFSKSSKSKTDLLFALPKRSLDMRKLTTDSLALAVSSDLLSIDSNHGMAISLSSGPVKTGISSSVRSMLRAAEKLGVWCSAISLHEVSVILKVGF
ncbi:MAG: hypothetical protein A2Z74_06645 [Chloroflexi bacterium RBG_13_46_9]|nr:MAG: hypothetical protein A2Z74_06645 [Chloroflexi bacterium RBG_13_46_9]